MDTGAGSDEYRAALGLAWLSDSGLYTVLKLLGRHGPKAIWQATRRELVGWGVAPGAASRFEDGRRFFVAAEAEALLEREAIRFVPFGSRFYPVELRHLAIPPAGLFVRAEDEALERLVSGPRVTIVGTRKATSYGTRAAEAFASAFVTEGVTVVSGMALGIDARAHEAAMEGGGLTVAVLGCGVDVVYPRRHASLYRKIARSGAVVSELPPGTTPTRWTFPHRNRLLAALGDAVIVIEASPTSGALQTADSALELGRPVFSVPGPIMMEGHAGCNGLLYEGAWPAIDPCVTVEDFFLVTRMERGERRRLCRVQRLGQGPADQPDLHGSADGRKQCILDALRSGPCSVDDLVGRTGLAAREITAALAELELMGRTARAGPGLHIRAP